jgi:hypothetical protein
MSRGHLALAAARGELVPLPEFLARAWEIMREEPAPYDGEADAGPALFVLEGGGQCGVARSPRARLELVPALRP